MNNLATSFQRHIKEWRFALSSLVRVLGQSQQQSVFGEADTVRN